VQHGALKDARLLAAVYLELLGGREPALSLAPVRIRRLSGIDASAWTPRLIFPTAAETEAHRDFVAGIPQALWNALEEQEKPQSAAATS
jgi:DNA polymerase-3 subunit epsilon